MDNRLNFKGIDEAHFFIGQITAFSNRLQAKGDSFFEKISWKQCFLLICIKMFDIPPTIKELSDAVGSSHQNVKQMLLKIEKAGFIEFVPDELDKRKQRISVTEKAVEFDDSYGEPSNLFIKQLYKNIDMDKLKITIETLMQLDENLKDI